MTQSGAQVSHDEANDTLQQQQALIEHWFGEIKKLLSDNANYRAQLEDQWRENVVSEQGKAIANNRLAQLLSARHERSSSIDERAEDPESTNDNVSNLAVVNLELSELIAEYKADKDTLQSQHAALVSEKEELQL